MAASSATPGAGWSHRRGAASPFVLKQLSERVWHVVEDDRYNEHPFLYIIAAPLFVVLIDTGVGTANYADFVLEFLAKQLGDSRPPLLVINTHCHFDHIGSNAFLAARGGELAASGANQKFTNAALAARDTSLAKMVGCTVAPYQISRWLANGEHIALSEDADDILEVLHTPGHTPDSLCLWLRRERVLFTGDTVYPHCAVIVANKDSFFAQFLASLELLDSFITARGADGVTLACGHIAEALPASPALSEILALARAVQAGRAPARPSRQPGVLLFERGNFSLTVKKTDPGVRPAGAMLSPRADRC